ncbi:MAG: IucA/IucC family C-terminal-domain containing protein, partial [Mycobacteriales bacterium]
MTSGLGQSLLERAVDTLAREYAVTPKAAAGWFLRRYADLFASSAVVLLAKYGIGIEGHLQNTLLVLGPHCEPKCVLLRDFGGARIHRPRLARAGYRLATHPGSLTLREEIEPVRRKAYYSCLQANMAEIVLRLTRTYGLAVATCWETVWAEIRRGLSYVQLDGDPGVCEAAEQDRTVLSASKAHQ